MYLNQHLVPPPRLRPAILGMCLLSGSFGVSGAAHPQEPIQSIAVLPLRIMAPEQPAQPSELGQRLAEAGTARAAHLLIRRKAAADVRRVNTAADCRAEQEFMFIAEVTLPVSLPQGEAGAKAMFRKGRFATAVVRLEHPDGKRLAEATAALDWDDVRWLHGVRIRRARPSADVLHDAVRKVIDRAVERLDRSLKA